MGRGDLFAQPRLPAWRRAGIIVSGVALTMGMATLPVVAAPTTPDDPAPAGHGVQMQADDAPAGVLVFHGPAAKQDDPVERAAASVKDLGKANGFSVDVSQDPSVFTSENLARYRGVVFLSANGVTLNAAQEAAFRTFIRDGGGFVGVHDAVRAQADSSWFTELVGTRPAGSIPPAEKVAEIRVSGENPPSEAKAQLIDGNNNTKWLTRANTGWAEVRLEKPVVVGHYALTSANDYQGRDPKNWTLKGSQDGQTWVDLDKRTNETFPQRFQTKEYKFDNSTAYPWYRLDITANSGEPLTQLAELRLFGPTAGPPPETEVQDAQVDFTDRQHPANEGLPLTVKRSDQWMNWAPNPLGKVHTIAQVEERFYKAGLNGNGPFHPISWCRDYDGGRSFYTGMGGTEASYTSDKQFQSHLGGAIKWAAGLVRGDCQATIASNYVTERLTTTNKSGQLDQIGEPHGLTVAPDGKVFYVGRAACPTGAIANWNDPKVGLGCGTIHQWDPKTKQVKLLTTLAVMGNRGSGDELVKNEEGLLGIVPDPKFQQNGWLYVYWMPHESIDRDNRIGQRTISRFTYDLATETIDQATRKDLLHWDTQIHSCCHAGGGMTFDNEGNLYVGSGDNNSSGGAGAGYAGNNWTLDYKGLSFQDARRTAGNTNNLGGKIIRIHPEPDGTYTIPKGNLFTGDEEGGGKTRPEIYVMGVRNISRLQWDPVNNWLNAAWVGPDAGTPSETWGPAKYETATIITSAGNQGWPYCMGNKQPYRDRSNVDASQPAGWYDCDNLKNTSPRNTGLVDIPPARTNMIWFSPQGGGPVYPKRDDGSGLPTYKLGDETFTQPFLSGGGQAIMSGPTYHRSEVDTDSGVAWPAYWENKWLIGDESNSQNRVAVTVDPKTVKDMAPPAFAEDLRGIIQSGSGGTQLQAWMDAKFGKDGALYMLDYAGGFFTLHANQKLIRVTYKGGPATPNPSQAAWRPVRESTPNTIAFSNTRAGGVKWEWDFGDGGKSTEAGPTHTYAKFGAYKAKLKVTYADGEVATGEIDVTIGCPAPDSRSKVMLLDTDTGVANRVAGGGCTINDLIDDERTWPKQSDFVSHLGDVVSQLRKDGIIDDGEAAAITKAAERSDIGKTNGYETVFDGTAQSFQDWTMAGAGQFNLQKDGTLRTSGGMGMLVYTKKAYADFSVRLKYRDVATGTARANTGVFIRFPDTRTPLGNRPTTSCGTVGSARTDQAWVGVYCGHEIQIYDGATGEVQKTGSVYNFAPVTLDKAMPTPKEVWNDYEIRAVGQHYTIIRNGVVINEFDNVPGKKSSRSGDPDTDLRQFVSGFVGLQNHSNTDLAEFRDIRVREL
ncbi:ThuA domain-containing protein [Microbispora sp. NBC_01189]|uniref:ThuA domain-containing protein n=1 Tax=Microbispora sp. NBC_01189 TaxID=2903583 RepID=UPI002E10237E|nr:ThuA domain-containing protein [Microbispora sp. NBC_01189]